MGAAEGCPGGSTPQVDTERESWLYEQPDAVLQAHAQECGIDPSECLEKRELVQRILQAEPHTFHEAPSFPEVTRERPGEPSLQQPDARGSSSQTEVDLEADEQLARRLQAEEDATAGVFRARLVRSDSGDESAVEEERPGGAQLHNAFIQALEGALRGSQSTASSPGGATARGSNGSSPGPAEQTPQAALALLLGQLMANHSREDSPGGAGAPNGARLSQQMQNLAMLSQLMADLMPNQGVDQSTVDIRTAAVTCGKSEATSDKDSGDQERKCMVCLEAFKEGEALRILPCLHRYHQECVDKWLGQCRRCPICQHDITK